MELVSEGYLLDFLELVSGLHSRLLMYALQNVSGMTEGSSRVKSILCKSRITYDINSLLANI